MGRGVRTVVRGGCSTYSLEMAIGASVTWKAVLLLLGIAAVVWAQDSRLLVKGRCPDIQVPSGFSLSRYAGQWYRIGGLPSTEEKSVNCTVYNYQSTGAGYTVSSKGVLSDFSDVTQSSNLVQSKNEMAQFTTTIRNKFDAEMVVISTDYDSYACVFTCYNFRQSHKVQFAWILSRTPTLDSTKIAACQVALKDVGVPIPQIRGTYQGAGCPH